MTATATVDLLWWRDRFRALPAVTWWGDGANDVPDLLARATTAARELEASLEHHVANDEWRRWTASNLRLNYGFTGDIAHLDTFDLDELERNSA